MRVLFATSSFARSADDPLAAAGKGVLELISELGTVIEGTLVTPAIADAPGREQIGGITVHRIPPARPPDSLANAITSRRAVRVGRVALAM